MRRTPLFRYRSALETPFHIAMTSAAVASSLGTDPGQLRSRVRAGDRGLSYAHRFADRINCPLGEIPWSELGIKGPEPHDSDRLMLDGCLAVLDRLDRGSAVFRASDRSRIGLFVGTTTCGIEGFFKAARQLSASSKSLAQLLTPNMQQAWIAQRLAERWNLRGPVYTFSSSCVASSQAFLMAHDAVKMGWIDSAVVLGVDILNLVTIFGFEALQLLDHELCRPFRPERAGINLSEAIVAVVLEKRNPGEGGARVRSFAALSEAHHMTQPAPGGEWMRICMERALTAAGLAPADISYVNPHGTGTPANDDAEEQALRRTFGGLEKVHPTKGLTGHTLGVSGLYEILISSLMLDGDGSAAKGPRFALKNSFGFGGADISIVLERGDS